MSRSDVIATMRASVPPGTAATVENVITISPDEPIVRRSPMLTLPTDAPAEASAAICSTSSRVSPFARNTDSESAPSGLT